MSFPASKTNRKKVAKTRGGEIRAVKMQITSLVDMMTVLVVFLLKSFSAEGDIVTPSNGLTLPLSTAKKKAEQAFKVSLTQEYLLVEGTPVISMNDMAKSEELTIAPLSQLLDERRRNTDKIAQNSTRITFKGDVLIEADRKVQFKSLQKVMYTCGQSGFSNFILLVLKKEG
ncbi:MAG: biopolymer transporter ExbD [Fibrobacterota bacterium]